MLRRALVVVAVLLSAAAASWHRPTLTWSADHSRQPLPGAPVLSGTVSCRQRVTLPGMATVRVELIDLSAKDARSTTVGTEAYWITGGKLPVDFRIPYDSSRIDPGHVYVVRARVMDGDKVLLVSTASYPVLTRGGPRTVDVVVVPAQSGIR
jgi:putative lipoprotein